MSSKLLTKVPCPKCRAEGGDRSGDNLAIYDDGHGFCFGNHGFISAQEINKNISLDKLKNSDTLSLSYTLRDNLERSSTSLSSTYKHPSTSLSITKEQHRSTMVDFTEQFLPWRGVSERSMRAFDVRTRVDKDGKPLCLVYPWGVSTKQVRSVIDKSFYIEGDSSNVSLFGMDKFGPGTSKAITVTEGAQDALSVYEMFGWKYPAVSVRSAVSARTDCERARDYLNSFDRIYLCFDNDKPGQDAVREVARLFDVNKIYHVKLSKYKDANEYLSHKASDEFVKTWWAAKPYLPKGIVADYESISDILNTEDNTTIASYPFATLDSMAYGIRSGEIVLITAQEKVGKTEVIRAIEHHLLKTTDHNIGVIHLEEKEKRSIQGLISYEVGKPCHLPDVGMSKEDMLLAYKGMTKRDGRLHFYTHFGSDDPDVILDVIRSLVSVCHCKFVFLDHITMLVTGFEGDDERRKLDYISTRLAMLTRELDFTLFLVSHVNDEGKTRGSRNISKVADLLLHLDRDIEADDADTRNATKLIVKGNRFASTSGPAGILGFDPKTYRVSEKPPEMSYIENPF